jgi:signal transduction histidine kinase
MTFFKEQTWFILLAATVLFVLYQLLKKPKKVRKEIEKPQENVENVVPWSKVTEIVEQERNRIASELHDELGTLLSIIHLDLELVLREAGALTPYGEARLLEVRKNLTQVIESIRNNIWSLSPQMIDEVPLGFSLRELCNKLDAYKGTHLNFVQSGAPLDLTPKQKLNLFRIVQELLTNAIKHSKAWNISVMMHWDDPGLTIVVEDDGVGYQRVNDTQFFSDGMGANNILRRANVIGASLKKEELTRGLRVTIELNLSAAQNQSDRKNVDVN